MSLLLQLKYWNCEVHNAKHFSANTVMFNELVSAIEATGMQVELQQMMRPEDNCTHDTHRMLAVLRSIHEVQGMKYDEGMCSLEGLESLVVKYLELRDGVK